MTLHDEIKLTRSYRCPDKIIALRKLRKEKLRKIGII
jgi:hypothetical protein